MIVHRTRRQIHGWCRDCAEEALLNQLRINIRKPHPDLMIECSGMTFHSQVRNQCSKVVNISQLGLPQDLKVEIHQLILRSRLLMQGYLICLHCDELLANNFSGLRISCRHCGKTWCQRCKTSPYHFGTICQEGDLMAAVRMDVGGPELIALLKKDGCQPCPGCAQAIHKTGGCNHMCCDRCGVHWCWLCRSTEANVSNYRHFNTLDGPETCRGRLFDV